MLLTTDISNYAAKGGVVVETNEFSHLKFKPSKDVAAANQCATAEWAALFNTVGVKFK